MSFAKSDVIQVIKAEGGWHCGILRVSTTYPITGKILFFPSTFCKPISVDVAQELNIPTPRSRTSPSKLNSFLSSAKSASTSIASKLHMSSPSPSESKASVSDSPKTPISPRRIKSLVIAISDFEAQKRNQLSFSKGDIIRVVKGENSWHCGILKKSSTYSVNGKVLFFPPNFVRPYDAAKDEPFGDNFVSPRKNRAAGSPRRTPRKIVNTPITATIVKPEPVVTEQIIAEPSDSIET